MPRSQLENQMDYDLSAFDVNQRRLIAGPSSNLMAISPLKHAWTRDIWKLMLSNTWFASEVDLSRDIKDYKNLSDAERRMFDKALAFLSNLDGIQFNNLVFNIGEHITSPEVSMLISRQAFEEALHVDAYSTMIEAISSNPFEVYTTFARDNILANKNDYILAQSAVLGKEFSPRNFGMAVVANIILEGIYFYSGFLAFYTLARTGKMLGSADMIRFIQRDEVVHLNLFVNMFKTLQQENPEVFDEQFYADAQKLFSEAVNLETMWGKYLISGGVLGLTDAIIDDYIRHLANQRLAMIGMMPLYPGVKNPVAWVEQFSNINGEESNFFESKVKAYAVGGTLEW
ncbi:NrdF Ribonucleotide reductase, beta subunit [uncultured Caudovirales phage]|uniref:ribonucleoside-diphosphate reductase n=1 Tax=uncultured Caudovirales phage TaxID=2100421 RepID=A0A6J5KKD3_9CAUD|nr:NrdF Ribonucleotide reductase, beta subunit [uncultured Caudovirales phage]CAB4123891.1 NrdF Ribonucleotide reductase, beta subunit [uncultured Caudovirales phage]CAB5219358.1 NrdF Ribonucleotide reductase, beta subunit [uncultured Caudovirales phage]